MNIRKMPIGIQSFEKLRREGFVYVDKTQYLWNLVQSGNPFFLSRPRRFGKSLFLSTLEAYFLGKKELFTGLALEKLEKENTREPWTVYPVLRFDLNAEKYTSPESLTVVLDRILKTFESTYQITEIGATLSTRFINVIRAAHKMTGRQVVVLVDEYDKPLIEVLDNAELFEDYRKSLKAFFGVLKSEDEHLKFAFLTGVTKFSQVSIFSDLNQLRDISMLPDYDAICGLTDEEIDSDFIPELSALAEKSGMTNKSCRELLRKKYDGYHFCENVRAVYNPFSVLNTFADKLFRYYWFQTGTPTFLVKMIEKSGFDIRDMVNGVEVPSSVFSEYRFDLNTPIPLLYQSGYLTIKGYNAEFGMYQLEFPNEEVKYSFLNFILPKATAIPQEQTVAYIGNFVTDIRKGNVDAFMTRLQSVLASVPYPVAGEKSVVNEQTFQTGVFLVFTLMGQFTQAEVHGAKGRADCVVTTKDTIYVFEFKLNGTAEEALTQIDEKAYASPYKAETLASGGRKIVKIGVGFDKETCTIAEWSQIED